MSDKTISYEGSNIAKTMAEDNFSSSLRMKTRNVKDIHLQMALQQFKLQERYNDFIKSMGWEHDPNASIEEQQKTVKICKNFYRIKN